MTISKSIRDLQRRYNIGIPGPFAIIYNATAAKLLRKPEMKIVHEIVENIEDGTMLDLGSGTGFLSIEVAKRLPGLQVYGIDISRQMVKIASNHARNVKNAAFKLGDAAELPFDDNSIDFIVSTGSMHHWTRPAQVFNECYRVLKINREAQIYDGCPDAIGADKDRVKREYGLIGYVLSTQIAKLHGFTLEEYQHNIKDILELTSFKGNYQIEVTDVWMKITLKKQ